MKKVITILIIFVLLLPVSSLAYIRYISVSDDMKTMLNDRDFSGVRGMIEDLKQNHPDIMPDEWYEKLLADLHENEILEPLEIKSEYDVFDDVTYQYFGDSRSPDWDNNCIIVCSGSDFDLSFFLPVESYLSIRKFAAVVNGSDRITGDIKDDVIDHEGGKKYERFTIRADLFYRTDLTSIAFRFYGIHDDTVDFIVPDDVVSQITEIGVRSLAFDAFVNTANAWAWAVNNIIDPSIVPYPLTSYISKGYTFYPSDLPNETLFSLEIDLPSSIYKDPKMAPFYAGATYIVAGHIKEIDENSILNAGQTVWTVNTFGSTGGTLYVIVSDHAKECSWDLPSPQINDTVVIACTIVKYKTVYLGIDKTIIDMAKNK